MKATLKLPKVKLTEPELLWLREAYELYKSGKEVNIRALRVRLRERLPVDFEPEKIDGRVLLHGRVITLYGIWHVDPSTSLLNEAGAVIEAIRKLIFEDPDRESIAAEEVANVTELPQPRVEMLIKQIRLLGFFWSEVEKASDDGYSEVKVKDSRVLKEYLQYEDIEQLIKRLSQKDEYAKSEEASIKASQTLMLNDGSADFRQAKHTSPQSSIDIFISHSSQDVKLAKELAEFLNIVFKTDKIRCTSVPGYRLEPGATVEETLRKEIHESKVFIGLITPASLTSHYVLFELGARWGAQLDLIPVLASGVDSRDLREPLKNRNPVRCDVRAEIRDLINKIAIVLGAEPYYMAVHEKLVDALIKKAKVGKERKHKQRGAESKPEENPRTESEFVADLKTAEVNIDSLLRYLPRRVLNVKGFHFDPENSTAHLPEIIRKLWRFDIHSLADLDKIVHEEYLGALVRHQIYPTYAWLLEDAMMFHDLERYFEVAWSHGWDLASFNTVDLLTEKYGKEKVKGIFKTYQVLTDHDLA